MTDKEGLVNILDKIGDPVAIIQDRQLWQKKPSGYSVLQGLDITFLL